MSDPVDGNLPPYLIPKSIYTAGVRSSTVADWGDLLVFTDHQRFCEAARSQTILRLSLAAAGTATESLGGPRINYSGTRDIDSQPDFPGFPTVTSRTAIIASGSVGLAWSGLFFPFLSIALLCDSASRESRIRAGGVLTCTMPGPGIIYRIAAFYFDAADIATANGDDIVSSFDFFGTTIPFMARDDGSSGDPIITSASIVATEV